METWTPLLKSLLYSGVNNHNLQQLISFFELRQYRAGHVLFREGDPSDGFYVIKSGSLSVSVVASLAAKDADAPDGPPAAQSPAKSAAGSLGKVFRPRGGSQKAAADLDGAHFLCKLQAGDWLGELSMLEEMPRTATVTCDEDSELLFISAERFNEFLASDPEVREQALDRVVKKRTANHLKVVPFFSFLRKKTVGPHEVFDEKRLALLGDLFSFQARGPDETVFRQGDPGDGLFIVVQGTVKVLSRGPMGDDIELACLTAGTSFGEVALLQGSHRTATVHTLTNCIFLFLKSENWANFLQIVPEIEPHFRIMIENRTANSLQKLPFFANVEENKPWSKLGLLGGLFTYETVSAGQVVFSEGDVSSGFYLIVNGSFVVTASDPEGSSVQLATLANGDWFGEIGLLADTIRTATVTAVNEGLLLRLSAERFEKFLQIVPEMRPSVERLVGQRTARTLKTIPLFDGILENKPWSKLDLLGTLFQFEQHSHDTAVFEEDSIGDKFYVLVQGTVRAVTMVGGQLQEVERLKPGDWFGEIALLTQDRRRTASVHVTSQTCLLLTLSGERFHKFLKVAPELKDVFFQRVRQRQARSAELRGVGELIDLS